jgi:hypothetical protein
MSIKSDFPAERNNFILLKHVHPQMYYCYIKSSLKSLLSVCPWAWEEEPQARSACIVLKQRFPSERVP